MIAAASLAAALHGLGWTRRSEDGLPLPELLIELHHITQTDEVSSLKFFANNLSINWLYRPG